MNNAPTTREAADHAELARTLRVKAHIENLKCRPGHHVQFGTPSVVQVPNYWNRDLASDLDALLSKIAALRGEVDVLEVERIGLRAAIFGSHDYDPGLRHGNFIEMARQTEEARKGALSRATQAERQRDEALGAARKLSAAISWTDYPFIDNNTSREELISRLGFMQKDAEQPRAFLANQGADQ